MHFAYEPDLLTIDDDTADPSRYETAMLRVLYGILDVHVIEHIFHRLLDISIVSALVCSYRCEPEYVPGLHICHAVRLDYEPCLEELLRILPIPVVNKALQQLRQEPYANHVEALVSHAPQLHMRNLSHLHPNELILSR